MHKYRRTELEQLKFTDDAGNLIDYGNRWTMSIGAPEDSYSVVEHPERFAPILVVAEALINHLASNYEVELEEGYQVTEQLMHAPPSDTVTRAVRLTPRSAGSTPIVFVLTSEPYVRVNAGLFFIDSYPSCACNACDENLEDSVTEFEKQVFAIVGGGLTEKVSEPRRPKYKFVWGKGLIQGMGQTFSVDLHSPDGTFRGGNRGRADSYTPDQLAQAIETLAELAKISPGGNWLPWQRK